MTPSLTPPLAPKGPPTGRRSRRGFLQAGLQTVAATATAPLFISHPLRGETAPNARIQLGLIGLGARGSFHLENALASDGVQVVSLCDVDRGHLQAGIERVSEAKLTCVGYENFQEMVQRGDLDAVVLALPDHWHAVIAIACLEAGLDVYGEVPLAHSIREGRAVCEGVKRYGRVWQTGSWQRSDPYFQRAAELVAEGRIGLPERIEIGTLGGLTDYTGAAGKGFYEDASGLNYDFWLGPAPWQPYHPGRVHQNWRWHLDYGGGNLMAWVGHYVDIALWSLGLDGTGPKEVEATGLFATGDIWNAPYEYDIEAVFPNDLLVRISSKLAPGVRWHGSDGWLYVDRKTLRASHPEILRKDRAPGVTRFSCLGTDHWENFLEAVRTRQPTAAPCESAQRALTMGQLGLISLLTGRSVRWDPVEETIVEDPNAAELLGRAYREPWILFE